MLWVQKISFSTNSNLTHTVNGNKATLVVAAAQAGAPSNRESLCLVLEQAMNGPRLCPEILKSDTSEPTVCSCLGPEVGVGLVVFTATGWSLS